MVRSALLFLLVLLNLTLAACGGGGDGGSESQSPGPTPVFSVGGSVTGLDSEDPDSWVELLLSSDGIDDDIDTSAITLSENGFFLFPSDLLDNATFTVSISDSTLIVYCTLNGTVTGTIAGADVDDLQVSCVNSNSFINGEIQASNAHYIDSDINDPEADFEDNSSFADAQPILNPVVLQGFLTGKPTETDGDVFADTPDPDDYFRTTLRAGQRIHLTITDHEDEVPEGHYYGDLDMILYDNNEEIADESMSVEPTEEITVPADGDYYIHVYAYSGTSGYVLQVDNEAPVSSARHAGFAEFIPGEAIVRLSGTAPVADYRAASMMSAMTLSHQSRRRMALARFDTMTTALSFSRTPSRRWASSNDMTNRKLETLQHVKRLRRTPGVELAEPNYIRRLQATEPNEDLYQSHQWNLPMMNLPDAWDISTGSSDVIVAVIDSGVFLDHSELDGKLTPGYDFVSEAGKSGDGDGIDPDPDDPGSESGSSTWHGTHVAGIAAAETNNNSGIAGVSWKARIMPLRALTDGSGSSYDVMQAVRFAAGLENDSGTLPAEAADVINLSLGGNGGSAIEEALFRELYDLGIIVVAAAGNGNANTLFFPAAYPTVLSVGAVDPGGNRAGYSNFGPVLDLVAPGGDNEFDSDLNNLNDLILSTYVDDSSGSRVETLGWLQGTSMAAPHVAGMIALMKAVHPNLSAETVRFLLADGKLTDDRGDPGFDNFYGFGLADANRALQAAEALALGGTPPAPGPFLVIAPDVVDIGQFTTGYAAIFNKGGGEPALDTIDNAAPWLTVEETSGPGLGFLKFTVNRTGFAVGNYDTTVTARFDNGDSDDVRVSMAVSSTDTSGRIGHIHVLLLGQDSETRPDFNRVTDLSPVGEDLVDYSLDYIRPGSYYVVAGSDIDNDGVICEAGESCGAYPSLAAPEPITIEGDEENPNVDFTTEIITETQFGGGIPINK